MRRLTSCYTLRPSTREERGCVCPFAPGCFAQPCRSSGTTWELRGLLHERYTWAAAPDASALGAERRANELQRIGGRIEDVRGAIRLSRQPTT